MRRIKLLVPLIAILTGLLLAPPSALASPETDGCRNTQGQYFSRLIPFFNTNLRQLTLVDPKSFPYRVVQIVANSVDAMGTLDYYSSWSPSCRYFAFSIGSTAGTDTILWDTVGQKRINSFHRAGQFDPPSLDWGGSDDYLIVSNYAGEFLWKVATNEQIQLTDVPTWYYTMPNIWDIAHGQTLLFDGSYVVAFDLNTGKALRKYPSPFNLNRTYYAISADGRTLRIWDQTYDKWSVTFDRATGMVIDAYAEADRPVQQVQFSPDRHYLIITDGNYLEVYDTTGGVQPYYYDSWDPVVKIPAGYYHWHFVNPTTIELDYTRTGQHQLIDLTTGSIR